MFKTIYLISISKEKTFLYENYFLIAITDKLPKMVSIFSYVMCTNNKYVYLQYFLFMIILHIFTFVF